MIELTKTNREKNKFYLNCDLIETIESTPDTIITLRNGKLVLVAEPPDVIIKNIIDYKRKFLNIP